MRPAVPAGCHICGGALPCWVEGCPLSAAAAHPAGPRRYRLGPALVAIVAVAVGMVMVFAAIMALAAIGGIKLAESTENRPSFVTPSRSLDPCPRHGGTPPC